MMHSALIHWLSPAERGRADLPPTLRYVGISRFSDDENWLDGAWSVELRFDQPPPEQASSEVSRGRVRFLVDEAPMERLHAGVWFGLFEGPQKVADVQVID